MAERRTPRRLRLLAGPLAIVSSAASAQAIDIATGNAEVDRFVLNVRADRFAEAVGQVGSLESITGEANAVGSPEELVAKLQTCDFRSARKGILEMIDLRWHCPDGDYFLLVDPAYRPPLLTVAEFVSGETRAARPGRYAVPPAPLPPPAPPPVTR